MTTLTQSVVAKAFVAFVTAAMVFSLVAPAAKADTTSDLQAQIAALMAQIEALKGSSSMTTTTTTTTGSCVAIPAPLTVGSTGANVMALQGALIKAGQSIPAGATGFFGPQTKAAVAAWQSANGVMPAVGYYGPITAAAWAAKCAAMTPVPTPTTTTTSTTTTTTTTTGVTLGTGEGSIDTVTSVSADETTLREGETDGLVAFEAEVTGDVSVDRVDFYMDVSGSGVSTRAEDYFSGANLMINGKKVATLNSSDFTEDTYNKVTGGSSTGKEYRLRFSGINQIFKDGDVPQFQLAMIANNVIDSGDQSAVWYVSTQDDGIRFVDGKGFSDTAGLNDTTSFSIDSQLVAEIAITESIDSPDATTLEVSDTATTKDVPVAIFNLHEKNGVDVTVDDMTFTVTATNTVTDESVVARTASIWDGSKKLASKTVTNGGVVNFENMGLELAADGRKDLTIKLELGDIDNYVQGETVTVAYSSTTAATDANGNNEGDMTITTGPVTSSVHTLRSTGLSVAKNTLSSALVVDGNDSTKNYGNFTETIDVTAFGDDLYIPLTVNRGASATVGAAYQIEDSNGNVVATGTASGASLAYVSGGKVTGQFVQVVDGSTARLTLNVPYDPTSAGTYRVQLLTVGYNLTGSGAATATETASPVENFETANLYVTN